MRLKAIGGISIRSGYVDSLIAQRIMEVSYGFDFVSTQSQLETLVLIPERGEVKGEKNYSKNDAGTNSASLRGATERSQEHHYPFGATGRTRRP